MPDGDDGRQTQHWDEENRTSLVLAILRGELTIGDAAEKAGVGRDEIEAWKAQFLEVAETAVRSGAKPDSATTGDVDAGAVDAGVWVWTDEKTPLVPVLLMDALCQAGFPLEANAEWVGGRSLPSPFQRPESMSLLYGRADNTMRLHMLSAKMNASQAFQRHTMLSDWRFPLQISAVLILLEDYSRRGRGLLGTRRPAGLAALEWCLGQRLPLVVGAMQLPHQEFSEQAFRDSYSLDEGVSVVAGPSLQAARPKIARKSIKEGELDLIGLLTGRGKLRFDPDYGKRLLRAVQVELRALDG